MLRFLLRDLKLNFEDVEIKEKYGDINFNINKILKKYKLERKIFESEIKKELENSKFIKNFEIVNDFINIYIDWPKLLLEFLNNNLIEKRIIANKILVEHTSANPNKALHIGHLRNACIGDCIYRLLKIFGNEVYAANYIDDTGSQMAELLVAFKYFKKPLESNIKFDIYCSKVYSEISKIIEKDENLKKIKSIIVKELEMENSFTFDLNQKIVEKVLKAQLETLWFFDIFFDFINKESDILSSGIWEESFKKLNSLKKVEYIENGEKVEKFDNYFSSLIKKKSGTYAIRSEKTFLVLIKSDGTTTYLAKDIAYAFWKHNLVSKDFLFTKFLEQPNGKPVYITSKHGEKIDKFKDFDLSINVIGREQAENQYVIEKLIEELANKRYIYYSYGLVFISDKIAKELGLYTDKKYIKMSGRRGLVVNVDELIEKFYQKVKERMEEEKAVDESLVKKIVKSCIRYELIKRDRNRDLVFDFEEAIKLDGNTAIYLIYTYARINSIVRNLEKEDNLRVESFECELNNFELNLSKNLLKFDQVINSSLKNFEIHQIANYCYELSKSFNIFYENCRVVDEKDKNKKELRKCLTILTKRVLEFIFDILGIEKIEKI